MSEEELLDAMCQAYWRAGPGIRISMRSILELLHANGYRRCAEGQGVTIQATHWDDCWKSGPEHYECAVEEVDRLRAEKDAIKVAAWDKSAEALKQRNAATDRAEKAEAELERLKKERDFVVREAVRQAGELGIAQAEACRMKADAKRYRWLCDNRLHSVSHPNGDAWGMSEVIYGDDLDAAIDKARGES